MEIPVCVYLAGLCSSKGLDGLQSQLADVFPPREEEVGHHEAEGGELALAGGQGRADGQQPISCRRRALRHSTQYGQSHAELVVPGTERKSQWWAGLRGGERQIFVSWGKMLKSINRHTYI